VIVSTEAINRWLERLSAAENLVEVARAVFALEDPRGLGIELLDGDGRPLVTISNAGFVPDQWPRDYVDGAWRRDPSLAAVRQDHSVVAFTDVVPLELAESMVYELHGAGTPIELVSHLLVAPLCGSGRVIGTLRLLSVDAVSAATRTIAQVVSTHTAVRLAELGFHGPDHAIAVSRLTPRQRDVAHLVSRGLTSGEIAGTLEISTNTVKKHLKTIFDALGVASRAELAGVASRFGASIAELTIAHDGLIVEWSDENLGRHAAVA
jgi:DNA-binding CsgD family transcriptional regulator